MKIIIFGASGGIGKFAVKYALKEGYEVKAYVRNPSKLNIKDKNLMIVKGLIDDYDMVKQAISGCDAVISAIGIPMKFTYDMMSSYEGHKNIIKAMQELGVSRIIDWATPSVKSSRDKRSFITTIPGIMANILFPKAKKEVISIANLITDTKLDWTIVRFIAPKDTPYTGKVKAGFGDIKMNFNISRADIGAFMVSQIKSDKYIYAMPIIGS